jgi:hypothetical protein
MDLASITFSDARLEPKAMAGMLLLTYFPEDAPEHPSVVALDIRWSKKDLLDCFEEWISYTLTEREVAGQKQERPTQRYRRRDYASYLQVYDLRMRRRTFKAIGETMWPGLDGDLDQKAREHFRRGKTIVLQPPLKPHPDRTAADRTE